MPSGVRPVLKRIVGAMGIGGGAHALAKMIK
jgi:hypothetical protein